MKPALMKETEGSNLKGLTGWNPLTESPLPSVLKAAWFLSVSHSQPHFCFSANQLPTAGQGTAMQPRTFGCAEPSNPSAAFWVTFFGGA